jgi:DNA-directed RNA polymerase subunit RPC12/RpoP
MTDRKACRCGKAFSTPANLNRHSKTCSGDRQEPRYTVCAACGTRFGKHAAWKKHQIKGVCGRMAIRAADQRFEMVYRCARCPSRLSSKSAMTQHLRNVHRLSPGAKLIAELAELADAAVKAMAVASMAAAAQAVEDILAPRLTLEEDWEEEFPTLGDEVDRLFAGLFDPML